MMLFPVGLFSVYLELRRASHSGFPSSVWYSEISNENKVLFDGSASTNFDHFIFYFRNVAEMSDSSESERDLSLLPILTCF